MTTLHAPFIDLFVYGTLRTGGGLAGWLDDSTVKVQDAVATGTLYSLGAFPCAMFDEPEGTIVGEIRTLRFTYTVLTCLNMEARAGFDLVEIEAHVNNGVTLMRPWGFHYPDKTVMREVIPHGDWFRYEDEQPTRTGIGKLT